MVVCETCEACEACGGCETLCDVCDWWSRFDSFDLPRPRASLGGLVGAAHREPWEAKGVGAREAPVELPLEHHELPESNARLAAHLRIGLSAECVEELAQPVDRVEEREARGLARVARQVLPAHQRGRVEEEQWRAEDRVDTIERSGSLRGC